MSVTPPVFDKRAPAERLQRAFKLKSLDPRTRFFFRRLDSALLLIVIGGLALITLGWVSVVAIGNRVGWFDLPALAPISDERILSNVRDDLENHALLDAVVHLPDDQLYLSQAGGTLYSYNPETHVWGDETPFAPDAAVSQDFAALRSGCGAERGANVPCPDADSLWALGSDGSLARRTSNGWEIVVANTALTTLDGEPITQDQLTSAAVAPDSEWLVIGTRQNNVGIGIYNSAEHRWLETTINADLNALSITKIVWWNGYFWIATPQGLGRLTISDSEPIFEPVPNSANVIDLDLDPSEENLWVLERRACANDRADESCTWLGVIDNTDNLDAEPQTVIDERNHFEALNLESVNFAQQISDDLYLAGDAGLYQYGVDTHTWERLFSRPVTATLPQNDSFFYAGAGRIGQISAQEPQQWTFANHDVLQLLADRPNEVLALANSDDETTALVSLSTQSGAFTPIFDGGGTHNDPASFTQAVALGDTVLFLGEGRGTFHNTRTRAYDDLPTKESGVPEWLSSANTRLLTSGEIVYGIVSNGRRSADIYPLPISLLQEAANFADGTVAAVESITLNTGIDQQWAWGDERSSARIGILGTNGVVSFIDANATPPVIDVAGAAEVGLIGFSPRDAAVLSNALVLTDGAQILAYDLQQRAWLEVNNPIPDMPIKQLLSLDDQLFLLTDDGRLIDPSGQTLIGGGPFTIPDEAISDALVDDAGAFLYLAGNGIVEPYDLTARQVRQGWNVPGAGDVLIEDTVDGQPLVLTESFAALGERAILPTAGAVLELSYDEASRTIWTLRQGEDHPYVMSHPVDQLDDLSARTCLFRQTSAGTDVQRVFDARTLPNGLVIVGTNAGVKFYSPTARSWYNSTMNESAEGTRLYSVGNSLLMVSGTDGDYSLAFVDASTVSAPHSCSIGQIALTPTLEFTAQSVTVDEATGSAAWLDADGQVTQWRGGTTQTLLAAPMSEETPTETSEEPPVETSETPTETLETPAATETPETLEASETETAPDTETFRRVYNRQAAGYVLFSSSSRLWLYDLRQRVWRPITLSLPENTLNVTIVDLNAERSRGNEIITARMSDGSFYYGLFVPSGDEVALVPVYAPVIPDDALPDDVDLDTLLDVQERASDGSIWTLLLNDRVLYFNTGARTWSQTTTRFPADETLEFQRGAGVGVVTSDNNSTWWIGEGAGEHPLRFTRYEPTASDQAAALDGGSQVWRLIERGEVQVCRVGAGATDDAEDDLYTCDIFYSPFIINPADVFHAFEWGEAVLLETTTGLRAFNVEQGIETPLPAEVAAFNSINASLEIDDHLFLYSDSRDTLLVLAEDLTGAVFEISDLRQDEDGRLWGLFAEGWRYYSNGDFVAANAGLTVFPASGGPVTALDTAGRLYRWQNSRFVADPLPLPPSITPTNIDFALQDVDGDWWLLADEQLSHVIREECVSDSALYPLSTEVARQTETAIPLATESANATRAAATLAAETTEEATEAVQSARLITLDDIMATAASLSPANAPATTPTPIPCLFTSETVSAGGITDVVSVNIERGALELVDRSGRVFRVDTDTLTTDTSDQPERVPAFALDDDWDSLSANVVTLPDGQTAYDPVIALEHPDTETPDALQTRRASGITATIAERGAFPDEFELPRALNAGWLRWSRRTQNFTLETSDGPTEFPPDALIVDGEFLFEDVNALLALNIDAFHAANRYGLWRYSTPTLNLNDETITYYPQTLTATAATPITAAHRRFYSGGRVYAIRAGQLVREDVADLGFEIGDVSFNEEPLEGEISVTARLSDGTQRNVLLDDGFLWDANRRQLAYVDGELLLQSDIGIHPVSRLEDFDVELDDLSTGDGILQSEGGSAFIFDPTSGVWYQRGADGWQRNVPNPLTNRQLFTTPFWTWRLNNTALDITLAGEAQNFAFTTADTSFNFDNVRGAAVHNGALFVASDAFIEVANPPNNLSSPSTLRLPPLQLDRLATYHLADGTTGLYAFDGGLVYRWDGTNFVPANINPDQQRPLVELPRLRLTLTGGEVLKELLVDDLNGGSSWAEFVLAEGRLPFDVVTGAQVFGDQLYLGSAAGLQIYPARTPLVLDSLATVYDMRPTPSGPLVAVDRLGIPEADSSLVMVFGAETASGTACIERTLSSVFQPCADPSLLVRSLRVNNSFWRWTFDGDTGALVGQYIAVDGTLDSEPISFSDGRLPHDRFDDVTVCNNRAFTLWDGRWISAYASNALSLETDNVENYLPTSRPNRLLCFEDNVRFEDGIIPAAAYYQDQAGDLYVYSDTGWQPIANETQAARIIEFDANRPAYWHDRLWLRRNADNVWTFEVQGRDDRWQALDWRTTAAATWVTPLEIWRTLVIVDGIVNDDGAAEADQYWAATPAGIALFERSEEDGPIQLNLDALTIVREPSPSGVLCEVTDLGVFDEEIYARCNASSDQLYRGVLERARDSGVFTHFAGDDPFAERELIALAPNGFWSWRLTGREGRGQAGQLAATMQAGQGNEALDLVGGQFPFDALTSIALLDPNRIDLAANVGPDAADGWFQAPYDLSIPVNALARPSAQLQANQYQSITINRALSGRGDVFNLCLFNGENYLRTDDGGGGSQDEMTTDCPEYLAFDDLWLYEASNGELVISAPRGIGGVGVRELAGGRFTDDIVTGLPITGRQGGALTYWLPTQAGVAQLDADLVLETIHGGDFDGLPAGETPVALYLYNDIPTYFADGTLYELDQQREALVPDFSDTGQTVSEILAAPDQAARLQQVDGQWVYVEADGETLVNTLAVDGSSSPGLTRRGYGSAQISVRIENNRATVQINGAGAATMDLPDGFELIDALWFDDRVLLIGRRDLLEINIASALAQAQ